MALIEIRTGLIGSQIKRIDKSGIRAVGGIVNRVAIGVGDASRQRSRGTANRGLKAVVRGIRSILERENFSQPRIWAKSIGQRNDAQQARGRRFSLTRDRQVDGCRIIRCHGDAIR